MNEILQEIRRVRDEYARESGYDIHRMCEQLRAETEMRRKQGWKIVEAPPPRQPRVKQAGRSAKKK
jgi:hypothetical protein